jgi:hypothetical protein
MPIASHSGGTDMIKKLLVFGLSVLGAATAADAQDNTLAAAIGVYVFPADGQEAAEQSRDEADCYTWAVDRTGSDPFELNRQSAEQQASAERAAAQASQAGRGAAAGGAVSGAAGGALIGAAFGVSKKSRRRMAAAGALAGGASGAAVGQQAQAQASRAASQAANRAQATEAQIDGFRTAFSTCMEANDYIAKF